MNIWTDFIEYIAANYPNSRKIVEVGVGKILEPSTLLKERLPDTKINLVDLYPANETVIKEDIYHPNDEIYDDADLIYSIRPPEELQEAIFNLGVKYDADIIIKPLFTEEINYNLQSKFKLINHKRTAFYIYKRK